MVSKRVLLHVCLPDYLSRNACSNLDKVLRYETTFGKKNHKSKGKPVSFRKNIARESRSYKFKSRSLTSEISAVQATWLSDSKHYPKVNS